MKAVVRSPSWGSMPCIPSLDTQKTWTSWFLGGWNPDFLGTAPVRALWPTAWHFWGPQWDRPAGFQIRMSEQEGLTLNSWPLKKRIDSLFILFDVRHSIFRLIQISGSSTMTGNFFEVGSYELLGGWNGEYIRTKQIYAEQLQPLCLSLGLWMEVLPTSTCLLLSFLKSGQRLH